MNHIHLRVAALVAAATFVACATPGARTTPGAAAVGPDADGPERRDPRSLAAGGYASVVCAAVFLQGRDAAEAGRNSTYFVVNDADRDQADRVEVDRRRAEVRVTVRGGPERVARSRGDDGCVLLPEGARDLALSSTAPASALGPAAAVPWPLGDAPGGPEPAPGEREAMARAIEPWFDAPEALTTAVVVVHRGAIVAERYAQGATRDALLDASAIGKSVFATLVGLLAARGDLRLDDAAPVPAWSRPEDPRHAIRWIDLLQMSSGLACTSPFDPGREGVPGYTDSQFVYTGAPDAVAWSTARPLAKPPGTDGRYANCDPLAALGAMEAVLAPRGETVLGFARRALYDRIGIRRMVTETDAAGHPLFIGYHFATARDLARLGLLYARDGTWDGARLLPEGFVRRVTSPAPAWKPPVYGAGFWVGTKPPLPPDGFQMVGFGGQSVLVVPSLDLVVVRLGHPRGGDASVEPTLAARRAILAAIR